LLPGDSLRKAALPCCGSGYYQYRDVCTYDTALGNPSRTFEDFHVIKLKVTTTDRWLFR
jgi:hypothetical protein